MGLWLARFSGFELAYLASYRVDWHVPHSAQELFYATKTVSKLRKALNVPLSVVALLSP
jgi:hypothetical protein